MLSLQKKTIESEYYVSGSMEKTYIQPFFLNNHKVWLNSIFFTQYK